jgi:hypothetical protein
VNLAQKPAFAGWAVAITGAAVLTIVFSFKCIVAKKYQADGDGDKNDDKDPPLHFGVDDRVFGYFGHTGPDKPVHDQGPKDNPDDTEYSFNYIHIKCELLRIKVF